MNNKKIKVDTEYSCTWNMEQEFLTSKGIRYTFVKTVDGVTIWKYKKTTLLFDVLSEFYGNVYTSSDRM